MKKKCPVCYNFGRYYNQGEMPSAMDQVVKLFRSFFTRLSSSAQTPEGKKEGRSERTEEIREPSFDLFKEEGKIEIVGELPGVTEQAIHIELIGARLVIRAEMKDRRYYKDIQLPALVDEGRIACFYRNGILDLHLPVKYGG